jgi:hypothetical protein
LYSQPFGSFFIAWAAFSWYSLLSRFSGFVEAVRARVAFWLQEGRGFTLKLLFGRC